MTVDVVVAARRSTRRLLILVCSVAALVGAICAVGLRLTGAVGDPSGPAPSFGDSGPEPMAGVVVVSWPADLVWVPVAGVALPVSATAGPVRQDDGLAAGFARSPAGAVLAAVHLLARTAPQVGSDVFGPTLREQVVGEHAYAMRRIVQDGYRALGGDAAAGGPVGALTAAVAGVRVTSFSDAGAFVDVLTATVDGTGTPRYAASLVELVWAGSDWRLVAPPHGRWDSVVRPIDPDSAVAYQTVPRR